MRAGGLRARGVIVVLATLVFAAVSSGVSAQTFTVDNGGSVSIDNGGQLDLGTTTTLVETGGGHVTGGSGTITATRTLNAPAGVNVAGLGAILSSAADLDSTVVTRGFLSQAVGSGNSIARYYDIAPTHDTGLDATLTLQYFDAELGGLSKASLWLYRSDDGGSTWHSQRSVSAAGNNQVTLAGIDSLSRWTAAQSNNQAPVAQAQALTVMENATLAIILSAADPNNDTLVYSVVGGSGPANGNLGGSAPTLTYTPTTGYVGSDAFDFRACDPDNACSVANVSINVTALPQVSVDVTLSGLGHGNVSSTPAGINCASGTCSADFDQGESVILTASPDNGTTFAGWTGCPAAQGLKCTLTVGAQAIAVSARFEPSPQVSVDVTLSGLGRGNVSSTPAGINCASGTCSADFDQGQSVILTASPGNGATFGGWTGCPAAQGLKCTLTVGAQAIAVSARFDIVQVSVPTLTPWWLAWLITLLALTGLVTTRRQRQ